ncbi:hypothetical protein HU200_041518 [Digitaria exilis]|uniref:Uncharacterized protein n=1 Tax=Digitaria exilis TaxID=1010633 RepID=A0A835EJ33_9POAL|nr:hypothetical protein HU200_041518 [Digitaria exilis]
MLYIPCLGNPLNN